MAISIPSMQSSSSIFATYASISTFIILIQTILNQLVPRRVQHYFLNKVQYYLNPKSHNITIVIEERDGLSTNEIFNAAEIYLTTKITPNIERFKISKRYKDANLGIKFAQSEEMCDSFQNVLLRWRYVHEPMNKSSEVIDQETGDIVLESEKRFFEIIFDNNYKDLVLDTYIPHVLEKAKSLDAENKVIKLHTLASANTHALAMWDSIKLEHPSTFDTLAMDPKLKRAIVEDLDRFLRRKDFYWKIGRAWKRGYLIYGPPGTGKSSIVAAMANYLKFDIYDLELANVRRDSDFRKLLLRTGNRSILVIEDIDCSVELPDRKRLESDPGYGDGHRYHSRDHQFTLSGLLNFIDGLWSSCGDERIIVFTTNNKENLDPALLRPGRMDMHIHMSYLTMDGFKLLASTYLSIKDGHQLFQEIEELLNFLKVTPAEVAEELMKCDDVDTSLEGLVNFLKCKKINY